jgi:hemolysin III
MPDWLYGPQLHYPTHGARHADLTVHVIGLVLAFAGGVLLVCCSTRLNSAGAFAAICIYAVGVMAMLVFSTAYNFSKAHLRPRLRRLDHAGIFLMIAASYTPFTTQSLSGAWAWAMTIAVWTLAAAGVLGKLFLPGLHKRIWIGVYLALGWMALVALKPMIDGLSWIALVLLALGGLIYSSGVIFYVNKRLRFSRAIWHGHVVAAAAVHWVAVLFGVVMAAPK